MKGEGSGGLGYAPGSGRSAAAAHGSGRWRRGSSHGGHGPMSGSRGARQTRELKAAAAPASSELDDALRLPWRGGFGSGIQTTSSISIACPCSALFVLPQWRARRPFIGGARRWPWQISRRPLYSRSVMHSTSVKHREAKYLGGVLRVLGSVAAAYVARTRRPRCSDLGQGWRRPFGPSPCAGLSFVRERWEGPEAVLGHLMKGFVPCVGSEGE